MTSRRHTLPTYMEQSGNLGTFLRGSYDSAGIMLLEFHPSNRRDNNDAWKFKRGLGVCT